MTDLNLTATVTNGPHTGAGGAFVDPQNVNDGAPATYGAVGPYYPNAIGYYALDSDLGVAQTASGFVLKNTIWTPLPTGADSSTDGVTWTPISYSLDTTTDYVCTFDSPVTARYFRLHFESLTGNVRISTWEITQGVAPPIVPKITITINSVEFTSLLSKEIRVEHNGPGACHFTIDRGDPQATEANLARGSIIQVTIPEIHDGVLAEFMLEEGDFDL